MVLKPIPVRCRGHTCFGIGAKYKNLTGGGGGSRMIPDQTVPRVVMQNTTPWPEFFQAMVRSGDPRRSTRFYSPSSSSSSSFNVVIIIVIVIIIIIINIIIIILQRRHRHRHHHHHHHHPSHFFFFWWQGRFIFQTLYMYYIKRNTLKGVLHPRPVFGLFLHFSQKLQHIGNK